MAIINLFAVSVRNYNVAPLNRVNIYFDKMPTTIVGELTSDKKTLNINLGNVIFTDTQQFINGEGIIQKAELTKQDSNTYLILSLSDARGFSIAKLPYSIGLIIEIFDWKKLDSTEESYRMGLLSLIDYEVELAATDLLKGANGNIADAAFFLGTIYLNIGKINTALKLFRFADLKKTSINDNYIALSNIYSYKKLNTEAEKYSNIYNKHTGFSTLPKIQFPTITESGGVADTLPYIDSVLNVWQDLSDTMPEDTTDTDTNKVEQKDTASTNKAKSIWGDAEGYLLLKYAIGIVIALILLVVYLYLKWRNKQLRALEEQKSSNQTSLQNNKKADFDKIITEKMKEQKSAVLNKNQQTRSNEVAPSVATKQVSKDINPNVKLPITKVDYKKNADELVSILNKIKKEDDVIKSDSILKAELSVANMNARKITSNNRRTTANVDLASRLLNEQKRLKQEKLSNLSDTKNLTPDKIDEVAKKIGVDKGSLATKQNIDAITQNEEELRKLSKKFDIKR